MNTKEKDPGRINETRSVKQVLLKMNELSRYYNELFRCATRRI